MITDRGAWAASVSAVRHIADSHSDEVDTALRTLHSSQADGITSFCVGRPNRLLRCAGTVGQVVPSPPIEMALPQACMSPALIRILAP
jgi:hypothetical protein